MVTKQRKKPVARMYLHKHIAEWRVKQVLDYLKTFGRDDARVERDRREVLLYLYDRGDLDLVRKQFGDDVDAWAELRR